MKKKNNLNAFFLKSTFLLSLALYILHHYPSSRCMNLKKTYRLKYISLMHLIIHLTNYNQL